MCEFSISRTSRPNKCAYFSLWEIVIDTTKVDQARKSVHKLRIKKQKHPIKIKKENLYTTKYANQVKYLNTIESAKKKKKINIKAK